MFRIVHSLSWVFCLALATTLAAQRRGADEIVDGPLGERCAAVVPSVAPDYWGTVLVALEGRIVYAAGYGTIDGEKGSRAPRLGSRSLLDLGSAAGLLTKMLALELVRDGKLQLEDPVGEHITDWPESKGGITIEHLLAHTSGLPNKAAWGGGAATGSRPAARAIGVTKVRARPGVECEHSPLDDILLALVCEAAAKKRFDTLLASKVLKRCGMKGAGPTGSRFPKKLVAVRRPENKADREPADRLRYEWQHRGARAVLGSVRDVHALLEALFVDEVLGAEQRDLLFRPVKKGGRRVSWREIAGARVLRLEGHAVGFRTWWTVHPASRSWIVLCTGEEVQPEAIEQALVEALAESLTAAAIAGGDSPAPKPAPKPGSGGRSAVPTGPVGDHAVAAAGVDRFVGTFELPAGGTFRIAREGGRLRLHAAGVQASVRLQEGRWPGEGGAAAGRVEDRGLWLLDRLVRGDATVVDEAFATAAAADESTTLLASLLAAHGPKRRLEFLGTRGIGADALSWFRMVGERGESTIEVEWADERRLLACRRANAPVPFVVDLQVTAPDVARGRSLAGTHLVLTVEGRGSARVLVFEDGSQDSIGLIDCWLVANRR